MKFTVMGSSDWPEAYATDFEILTVKPGESFEDAILRAKNSYSPDLECYIVDESGTRIS